jgi:hypothetical protein
MPASKIGDSRQISKSTPELSGCTGESGSLPVSRRALIGMVVATGSTPPLPEGARLHEVLDRSRAWLAIDVELDQLTLAWQDEESRLAKDFGWLRLPELEQRSHSEARAIYALDDQIKVLTKRRWALLETLETLPSIDIHDVLGKLTVAMRAMRHEDAVGFDLLAEAVRELSVQRCRTCGAVLIPPDLLAQG